MFKSQILAFGKIYLLTSEEIGFIQLSNLIFIPLFTALGSSEFTVRFAYGEVAALLVMCTGEVLLKSPQEPSISVYGHFHSSSKQSRGSGGKSER